MYSRYQHFQPNLLQTSWDCTYSSQLYPLICIYREIILEYSSVEIYAPPLRLARVPPHKLKYRGNVKPYYSTLPPPPPFQLIFSAGTHTTVNLATAALQNGVWVTQQMFHIKILFHNCSTVYDKRWKYSNIKSAFSRVLINIGSLMEGKLINTKSVLWWIRVFGSMLLSSSTLFVTKGLFLTAANASGSVYESHLLTRRNTEIK